jgi:predicted RNase H-like HicB family nuclease
LHVQIERDNDWLIAQALEEPSVITQGRTINEIVRDVREVVELLFGETDAQLELLVPTGTVVGARKQKSRVRRKPTKRAA